MSLTRKLVRTHNSTLFTASLSYSPFNTHVFCWLFLHCLYPWLSFHSLLTH
ncbi:uncharacterized protein LACBIDRAFT_316146 [Laccaria bicolor S238N-H82]|uniref:Predicted protein n=1 Tax=Laccaria bicolor (strain S238N-H82 / ATCC MYA-4686) TaxID=486041 RepID=B0D237_LACBS|nr:uncharacterized protein LACBIDRAFT_316146 [Laccaria bicolor S238N-H82]EDR11362.1 predicted protein [Laccaria bicolor S238N-H82]|eukprot:XP_001878663.1 predicted protein [Laccaria bicolor S238N-H82]